MAFIPQEQENIVPFEKKKRTRRSRRHRSNSSSSSSSDASTSQNRSKERKSYKVLSESQQAKYVAMDCEMVGVGIYGERSALARVTIVNWSCETIYDEYVQPNEQVTDYRTFVSGVTADDLVDAVSFESCRARVAEIIRGKILVGHGLRNDLHALHLHHPWQDTRDTARYEPFQQVLYNDGVLWPRKLKDLCTERLNLYIQVPGQPHSPYQDAVAALKLYKSVRLKWEKVMTYKIKKTTAIQKRQHKQQQAFRQYHHALQQQHFVSVA